jgi:hypothetical protein
MDPNFSFGNADMNFLKSQHEESQRNKTNIEESMKVIQKVDSLLSKPKRPFKPSRAMYFDENIHSVIEFKR